MNILHKEKIPTRFLLFLDSVKISQPNWSETLLLYRNIFIKYLDHGGENRALSEV